MSSLRSLALISLIVSIPFLHSYAAEAQASGLSPQDAAKAMTVPGGFNVTLFAGEPDVVEPAAMELDDRGRLWVAEFKSYPNWKPTGSDRILIFEDTNHDGRFDTVKTFWDKGNYLSGFALGFGGVFVCSAPNLYFIPLKEGTDEIAGEPQVLLDGWSGTGKHNVFNSLTWGPDGWLYGCSGITGPSRVGKPGTPDEERIPINCGVWRYHPTKKVFEAVLHGTTNPWGIDFDDWGQMFITNTVIGHLWHVIPGMHTDRMFGEDYNPYTYGLIAQCADHIHWAGGSWQGSRGGKGAHDLAGGGHSHAGAMIYSGDNWPDQYRNTWFTINTHGNRINNDILKRQGSGYVGTHGKDFLFANDQLFRGTVIKSGPDGGVYIADWNQGGECHSGDLKTTGRIYKINYGTPKPFTGDVAKLSDEELVQLQLHKNDWFVRHARRILQERAAAGSLKPETAPALLKMFNDNPDVPRKLRALWALHCIGASTESLNLFEHPDENVRAWAVRLLADDAPWSDLLEVRMRILGVEDKSPLVRLHLASALQRMPVAKRFGVLHALLLHEEDATDHNLPLMYWYALEPLVPADPNKALGLARECKIPLLRNYIARRLTEIDPALAVTLLLDTSTEIKRDVLDGMNEALHGQRNVPEPKGWVVAGGPLANSPDVNVRKAALRVAIIFGDRSALDTYRKQAVDANATVADRQCAIEALVEARDAAAPALLKSLLDNPDLRLPAIRGLSAFNDEGAAAAILKIYPQLTPAGKGDALYTLGARPAYVRELLKALQSNVVPKTDLNTFHIRYFENAGVPEFNDWIKKNWGETKQSSEQIQASIKKYTAIVKNAGPQASDLKRGQLVFKKTCQNCHTLFGEGGKVGPDLTGSGRKNLDYLMLNVVDPNALVPYEYQMTVVRTKDGRVVSGILRRVERPNTIELITPSETVIIEKNDIVSKKTIAQSMMPEGILDSLSEQEVIDLAAYLQSDGVK